MFETVRRRFTVILSCFIVPTTLPPTLPQSDLGLALTVSETGLLIFVPSEQRGWLSVLLREWLQHEEMYLYEAECKRRLTTGLTRLLSQPPVGGSTGHFRTWMWLPLPEGESPCLVAGRWVPATDAHSARWVVTFRRDQVPADGSIDHVYQQMLGYSERMAHSGSLRWEPQTDSYLFSDNLPTLLGFAPETREFPLAAFMAAVNPAHRPALQASFAQVMSGASEAVKLRYALDLPQQTRWIEAHMKRHYNPEGWYLIGVLQDVTEAHERELKLARREALYRSLVESQSTFLVRTDLEARYTFVNQAFLAFFGFEAQEVLGKPYDLTVHPDDQSECEVVARRCLIDPHGIHRVVMRKPNKDGQYFWSRWEFRAIFDEQGTPVEVQAVGTDITEQIEAEQALQRRNEELSAQKALLEIILDNIQDGVVVCGLQGEFLVFNRAAQQYLGMGAIDTSPKQWQADYGIFHTDQKTPFAPEDLPMARGLAGERVRNLELFIRNVSYPQGHYLNAHASPLCDPQGQQIGAVGVLHDIDALKRLNERLEQAVTQRTRELRDSEARYRQLTELSRDVICLHDPDGTYRYVSPAIYELTGYQPEELLGYSAYDFIDHNSHQAIYHEHHRPLLQGASPQQSLTYRFRCKDGSYLWLESLARPIIDEQGQVVQLLSSARDITERKEAEARIEQALQRERELNELKSRFVSTASHQFRTPLSTIQSSAQLLQMRLRQEHPSEPVARLIERLLRQAQRMSALIDDVLTLSRVEEGRLPIVIRPHSLVDLLHDLIESLDAGYLPLSITGKPYPLACDADMLRNALSNLLHNALKYSAHQDRPPEVLLAFAPDGITLDVKDHGIGVPSHEVDKLFQPFYRAKNATHHPGTGLGLVIAREIIERHGGSLALHRSSAQGSCFRIWLPRTADQMSDHEA